MNRQSVDNERIHVSVITRTKDRPITLRRALESVRGQIFTDYEWIVVNDGGAREPVDTIAEGARQAGIPVHVAHNPLPKGRPGALNEGLRHARGQYVAVHDDDDTWEPAFLALTSSYLSEQTSDSSIHGVVTRSTAIEEIIDADNNTIKILHSYPYDKQLKSVTLYQMAKLYNVFPPISFLYKRSSLESTGYYREDLPVLEDWEFNLRFLRYFDIGVIPMNLANYHFRTSSTSDSYSNSVIDFSDQHEMYHAKLRNELLRNDLNNNRIDIGFLINICHDLEDIKNRTAYNTIVNPIYNILPVSIINLLKKFRRR